MFRIHFKDLGIQDLTVLSMSQGAQVRALLYFLRGTGVLDLESERLRIV